MKRPFFVVGSAMFFTLLFLGIFSSSVSLSVIALIFSLIGLFFSLVIPKTRKRLIFPFLFVATAIACVVFSLACDNYNKTIALCGTNVRVTAEVKHSPEFNKEYSRYYCVAKIETVANKKGSGNIRFSFNENYDEVNAKDLSIGDKVSFTATVYQTGSQNASMLRYFKSQRIYLGAHTIKDFTLEKTETNPFTHYTEKLQKYISWTFLREFSDDVSGILISVLTGNKDYLSDEVYSFFKLSGVAHIMAVSGLHLSIYTLFLGALLDKSRLHKIFRFIILGFAILLVMAIANFSPSVKRAGTMMLIYFFGKYSGKNTDSLNNLGFSAFLILFANPFSVFDVGFLLSFLCSFAILYVAVPLNKFFDLKFRLTAETFAKQSARSVIQSFTISVSVIVFTGAITAVYFGNVCLVSPLTNLLLIPIVPVLLLGATAFLILGNIPFFDNVLTVVLNVVSTYSLKVAKLFSKADILNITINTKFQEMLTVAVFFILCVATILFINKIKEKYKTTI